MFSSTRERSTVLHLALIFHHRPFLPLLPALGIGAVQMNSLAYLSRQFDVLASAKTPPSTPSSDRPPFIGDRLGKERASDPELPRVSTWSTKSFLFPSSPNATSTAPKRSFSSPAFASIRKLGLQSSITPSASPDVEARPWSKSQVERIIRRIFFIRVFVLVWDNLRAAWLSLWKHGRLEEHPISISTADKTLEVGEETMKGDLVQPLSPAPSILPASLSHTSDPTQHISIELAVPSSTSPPTIIRSSDYPLDVSRSSTPSRKTPFNLPKTLVLDLDETLIHSTSRPMHSSGGGGGFFGLGSFRTRNKGASHMVEVVLGGRSTLYHVYKRPFVDFFLRTVRCCPSLLAHLYQGILGFRMVYTRDFHGLDAGVCRSGDRLAGRWTWYP